MPEPGQRRGPLLLPGDGVFRPHPLAEIFPVLEREALAELADDIGRHGLREPIVMLDGMVLDGRNRYLAARDAGVPLPTVEYDGDDPLAFVISRNLRRRHLSESQRAMLAARIADMPQGARTDLAEIAARSQPDAAALLNVSRGSVQNAKRVLQDGSPSLVAAVEANQVSVSAAAIVARLPEATQDELVDDGPRAVRAAAKGTRCRKPNAPASIDDDPTVISGNEYEALVHSVLGLDNPAHGGPETVWLDLLLEPGAVSAAVEQALSEARAGDGCAAVLRAPATTSAKWFQKAAASCAAVCLVRAREHRVTPEALFYFGPEVRRFGDALAQFGVVMLALPCASPTRADPAAATRTRRRAHRSMDAL